MEKLDDLVGDRLEQQLLRPERLETVIAAALDRGEEHTERRREHLAELNKRAAESELRLKRAIRPRSTPSGRRPCFKTQDNRSAPLASRRFLMTVPFNLKLNRKQLAGLEPPYSPDMNPIEMASSKLKALLRQEPARTVNGLVERIGRVLHRFQPDECANFFQAAGYQRSSGKCSSYVAGSSSLGSAAISHTSLCDHFPRAFQRPAVIL